MRSAGNFRVVVCRADGSEAGRLVSVSSVVAAYGRVLSDPVTESVTQLVPVPEDVQLPSPTSSEEEPIPIPPPRASTPGREVSGQRCWTQRKFDKAPGGGASGRLFWHSSGLRGKDRARPYPAGRGETRGSAGDWRLRAEQHAGPSEPPATSHWPQHGPVRNSPSRAVQYGWKSLSSSGSP